MYATVIAAERAEAKAEGKAEAKAEAKAKAKVKEKRAIALRMMQKGKGSDTEIAEDLDLPVEDVTALRRSINQSDPSVRL